MIGDCMVRISTPERAALLEEWMVFILLVLQRAQEPAKITKKVLWDACGFENTDVCLQTHLQLKDDSEASLDPNRVKEALEGKPVTKQEFDAILASAESEMVVKRGRVSLKQASEAIR